MSEGKSDHAWKRILREHPYILSNVERGSVQNIEASLIKEYREPRLMTKHDSSESVPAPLRKPGLDVLPISRKSYVIGDFALYQDFPEKPVGKTIFYALPKLETLTMENITSESNAINALKISGILEHFLNVEGLQETFNGRMGSGDFTFCVDRVNHSRPAEIDVSGAQIEIDGGFECDDCVVIMEAKNVLHPDFNIRQLYYPFRKYHSLVHKPIRLVFSQYLNMSYRLLEYEFEDPEYYNSIRLVQEQSYTFEDDRITSENIRDTWLLTQVLTDDDRCSTDVPFIQADKVDKVIALMERLKSASNYTMTTEEVSEFLGVVARQANYYPSAGRYLGVFERREDGTISLSTRGLDILQHDRKQRLLDIIGAMFEHRIFHDMYQLVMQTGRIPEINAIADAMRALNICESDSTTERRARTVRAWLQWIDERANE